MNRRGETDAPIILTTLLAVIVVILLIAVAVKHGKDALRYEADAGGATTTETTTTEATTPAAATEMKRHCSVPAAPKKK